MDASTIEPSPVEWWDRYWSTPDPDRRDERWTLFREVAQLIRGARELRGRSISVADVGCGIGPLLDVLSSMPGVRAVGIDSSSAAAQACRVPSRGFRFGHQVVEGLADAMPVMMDGFDVIAAVDLISFVANPTATLDHWRDNLSPGGSIIVATPVGTKARMRAERLFSDGELSDLVRSVFPGRDGVTVRCRAGGSEWEIVRVEP